MQDLCEIPQLWVFAGPNGAGKSTLVAQRVRGRLPVVNPDEIAQAFPLRGAQLDVLAAGRVALTQREALLAAGRSFGIGWSDPPNSLIASQQQTGLG